MRLPPVLTPWAETLSLMDARLAVALGPMIRTIDELVRRGDVAPAPVGELDGYDGLSRRGDPERLLISEWALADAAPWEFLRRAAQSELLYLERSHLDPRPRGRVAVLTDCGAEQVGPGRLVQLAALIVLIGRAARHGLELQLGVLGEPADDWVVGPAEKVLDHWLRSRTSEPGDPLAVARRHAWVDDADELWLLCGPRLAAALPARRRTVVSTEAAWSEHGASAMDVVVDGHRAELALPHGGAAVRALRDARLRDDRGRRGHDGAAVTSAGPPAFTSASPTLLVRGAHASELVRIDLRPDGPTRPRRHRFPGSVVTAAAMGRRLVALVEHRGQVDVVIVGKHLGRTGEISVSSELLLEADAGTALGTDPGAPLAPLVFQDGRLLTRLGGRWWWLDPRHGVQAAPAVVAARPSAATDRPAVAHRSHGWLQFGYREALQVPAGAQDAEVVLGAGSLVAWQEEPGRWRLPGGASIMTEAGDTVLGLHQIDDAPALVTLSGGGLLVRLRWAAGTRTLTRWSGATRRPAVHPTLPWLAVARDDGAIEVADLRSGEPIHRVDGLSP